MIPENAKYCPSCGAPQMGETIPEQPTFSDRDKYKNPDSLIFPGNTQKSPVIAAIFSAVFAGLGQLYLGQGAFGLVLFIIDLAGAFVSFGTTYFVLMVMSVYWAYRDARTLNNGTPIRKWGGAAKLKY